MHNNNIENIGGGSVVYDSYGKKCQHRFLLNYGFAVENNVEEDGKCPNEIYFKLHLLPKEKDPMSAIKSKILEQVYGMGSRSRGLRISTTYKSSNTLETWSFLRFVNLNREETTHQMERSSAHMYNDISSTITSPVSIENEIKCLKMLGKLMLTQLKKYDTTLEEDLKLLNDPIHGPKPFTNRRNALIFMAGEKKICHFYIDLMKMACKAFTYNLAQMQQEMKRFFDSVPGELYNGKAEYLTECVAPLLAHRDWEIKEKHTMQAVPPPLIGGRQ